MIRSCFRISGLFVLTAASLLAQRRGGAAGSNMPVTSADLIVHGSVALPGGILPGRLVRVEDA